MHMIYDANELLLVRVRSIHTFSVAATVNQLWFWSSMLKRTFNFQSRAFIIWLLLLLSFFIYLFLLFFSAAVHSLVHMTLQSSIASVRTYRERRHTQPKMTYSMKSECFTFQPTIVYLYQQKHIRKETPHTPNATIHKTVTLENQNQ